MEVKYLVINENYGCQYLPIANRYKLFDDYGEALKHAKSIGFASMWADGPPKPGYASTFEQGDIRVQIISLTLGG